MDRRFFILNFAINAILWSGSGYLIIHLAMMIGAQREKNSKECLPPITISAWEEINTMYKERYVVGPAKDIQKLEDENADLIADRDKWIGNFNWIKKERDSLLINDKQDEN